MHELTSEYRPLETACVPLGQNGRQTHHNPVPELSFGEVPGRGRL